MGSSGLCNRMNLLFKQERKLRMEWQFINGGQYGSTTEDWLPIEAYSNYCRIVERYPQVQVVFIMLGSSDRLKGIDAKQTIENLKELVYTLNCNGKIVFVSTIPEYTVQSSDGTKQCNV